MPILQGTKLPPFPFQVVCEDNSGREDELVVGRTYTVLSVWGDNSSQRTACSDLVLQGVKSCFGIRRFHIIVDLSDWRVWRDHGLEPGHCVCRIPKELCRFHRDT